MPPSYPFKSPGAKVLFGRLPTSVDSDPVVLGDVVGSLDLAATLERNVRNRMLNTKVPYVLGQEYTTAVSGLDAARAKLTEAQRNYRLDPSSESSGRIDDAARELAQSVEYFVHGCDNLADALAQGSDAQRDIAAGLRDFKSLGLKLVQAQAAVVEAQVDGQVRPIDVLERVVPVPWTSARPSGMSGTGDIQIGQHGDTSADGTEGGPGPDVEGQPDEIDQAIDAILGELMTTGGGRAEGRD